MKFQAWLERFIEEKQIDLSEFVSARDCTLQVGDVLSAILSTTSQEQATIKATLVKIDFHNGDVMDYIRHLAQALGPEDKVTL